MFIPIHVPIGSKHVATARGTVWKVVACTQCNQRYAYLLELKATGERHDLLFFDSKGSAEQAQNQATSNLAQQAHNVVRPVPCPNCGCYQEEMARMLTHDASINRLQIAGLAIVAIAFIPLAFDSSRAWVITAAIAAVGVVLAVYGCVRSFRFDPNEGDPEPRKALGRAQAVWGQQLSDLLAASSLGEREALPGEEPGVTG